MTTIIHTDGGIPPKNPGGYGTWGFAVYDQRGKITHQEYGCLGTHPLMTNNVSEYQAVIEALRWCDRMGIRDVLILSDSQLIVNQASGKWRAKDKMLAKRCAFVRDAAERIGVRFQWIPREENSHVDKLCHRAYEEYLATHV